MSSLPESKSPVIDMNEVSLRVKDALSGHARTLGISPPKREPIDLTEAIALSPKTYPQTTERATQKTKDNHKALYENYIEIYNSVSAQLDSVDKLDVSSNYSPYVSLKAAEAFNSNAVWLHELFFANCFDPNSEVYRDSVPFMKLERDFGSFENWQRDFIAAAMGAGEGWVVTAWHLHERRYVNLVINGHSDSVTLGAYPAIVLDMWSHAYYRDYLSDKRSYIVAMMRELNWGVIEQRFAKCEKVAEALK